MTFDIGLHEVCVRTGVRYVITKFSGMDGLPNFLTHGAPLRARGSSAIRTKFRSAMLAHLAMLTRLQDRSKFTKRVRRRGKCIAAAVGENTVAKYGVIL